MTDFISLTNTDSCVVFTFHTYVEDEISFRAKNKPPNKTAFQ